MIEVNFIQDNVFNKKLKHTGKVKVPFLPRKGDVLQIQQFVEDGYRWEVTDVLICYETDFSVLWTEIFVTKHK
jgi:hypothetical protein